MTTNNTPYNLDKGLDYNDLSHVRITTGLPIHNSMVNYKVKE